MARINLLIDRNGITIAKAVLVEQIDNVLDLASIDVDRDFRGQGFGSALLKASCELADRHQRTMDLIVSGSGPMTDPILKQWYQRHGFHGGGYNLIRPPRKESVENGVKETIT